MRPSAGWWGAVAAALLVQLVHFFAIPLVVPFDGSDYLVLN